MQSSKVCEGPVLRAGARDAERRASEPEQIFLKETAHELSLKGWLDFARSRRGSYSRQRE